MIALHSLAISDVTLGITGHQNQVDSGIFEILPVQILLDLEPSRCTVFS